MPRTCTPCQHEDRRAIDTAIASGALIRGIARTYRVSEDALQRHKQHVASAIVKAAERREERLGDGLLAETDRVRAEAWRLLAKAEGEGDIRAAIGAAKLALESNSALADMLKKSNVKGETVRWVVEAIGACPHCGLDLKHPETV